MAVICAFASLAQAMDLSLTSAVANPSGTATLSLTLNAVTTSPAGLQWSLTYPAAQFSAVSVTAGPVASAGAKTLGCVNTATGATCLLAGLNNTGLTPGVVAYVTATVAPGVTTSSIQVSRALGADVNAKGLTVAAGAAGTILAPSPAQLLTPISSVSGQQIYDFDGASVLFSQPGTLLLHDLATGGDRTLFTHAGVTFPVGFLTSHGAIFAVSGPNQAVYEYRDGALLSFAHNVDDGTATTDAALVRKANFALWRRTTGASSALYFRDLTAGANTVFTQAGSAGGDVGPDGSVVYANAGDIYRWLAGNTVPLTSDALNRAPVTDGRNVVYEKASAGQIGLYQFNGSATTAIAPLASRGATFDFTYQAAGGSVAWTANDAFADQQVYLTTPTGNATVSRFGSNNALSSLAANGDVAYRSAAGLLLQRTTQTDSILISTGTGVPLNVNNQWYYIEGATVYQVGNGSPNVYQGAGSLQISVVSPVGNAVVTDPVPVSANISSYYAFQSVTASAGTRTVNLTALQPGVFSGSLPITGLTGPQSVVIAATDIFGHAASTTVPIALNSPLTVTVNSPISRQLTQGPLPISASCGGCVSMRALLDGTLVAKGASSISQTISVTGSARSGTLSVYGTDSAGHDQVVSIAILYEPAPALMPVTSVNGQQVLDFDGTNVLYAQWLNGGGSYALLLHPVAGGADQTLIGPVAANPVSGYLTAHGAIFLLQNPATASTSTPDGALYEWRDGRLLSFGHTWNDGNRAIRDAGLLVKGNYAIYQRTDIAAGGATLYFRDLLAGVTSAIAPAPSAADLGSDGTVVLSQAGDIYRWSGGVMTRLTFDGVNDRPFTDGPTTVYVKSGGGTAAGLYSSGDFGETPVEAMADRGTGFLYEYQAANSNLVYTESDTFSTQQLYLNTPFGSGQLSYFGSKTDPVLLSPNGDVYFRTQQPGQTARYYLQRISNAGVLPVTVSNAPGVPFYVNGQWYYAAGNAVLAIGQGTADGYLGPGSAQIRVTNPLPNSVIGSQISVQATVDSYYALQSVTAGVGYNYTFLYPGGGGLFSGSLWTTDLTGPQLLIVSAQDVFGHAVQQTVPVTLP